MSDTVQAETPSSQRSGRFLRAAQVIVEREGLRFVHQRGRFIAALVRPLVWLFIFAAGFRSVLGVSIQPPYVTYVLYEVYITPGLRGMILLFAGMQSSLAMVYDREMGSMRVLLVSPLPRWYLLVCKLMAGVFVAVLQVYVFLAIAWF
ncbi:MAG: ABC transporter permease, partial [Geminicoccaceae bacterium]